MRRLAVILLAAVLALSACGSDTEVLNKRTAVVKGVAHYYLDCKTGSHKVNGKPIDDIRIDEVSKAKFDAARAHNFTTLEKGSAC